MGVRMPLTLYFYCLLTSVFCLLFPALIPIRQGPDRHREGIRLVPAPERLEVGVDQVGRPVRAVGDEQGRFEVAGRQRITVDAPHAELLPVAERFPFLETTE